MCRFHWPSALRQHALLKRLANPLAHVLDGEGHSCVSGLRIECLALADYYRLWPCSTRARTSSRAFCSDISWTKIPSASPTLALANQAPGRCSCTSSLEVQDTHTCMHAQHTHTRTLAHLSPSACCFTQARYWYRNQAPEFLATSVVTQAYRHAIQEAALYAATSEAPQASEGGDMMMDHSMLRRHRKLAEEMDMDHDADMDTGMGGPGGGHTGDMFTGNEERTIAGMATRWGTPGRVQVAGQIPLAELWLLDLDSWRLLALGGRGAHAQPSSAPTWL